MNDPESRPGPEYHCLGQGHPTRSIGITMLLTLSAVLVDDDPEDPSRPERSDHQHLAAEVASTIVAKAGHGVDAEPGDVLLVDVERACWCPQSDAIGTYASTAELQEQARARRDWMIPDLDVPRSDLDALRDEYRALVHEPNAIAEAAALLHRTARALGWSQS